MTGPWMKQLYGNPGITNLDTISYIKTCLQYLKSLKDCPLLLVLTTCTDIFGIDLDKETDVIQQCLQSYFNLMNALEKASLNEILFRLITGIIEVIERQMYDYIEGNLSNIPTLVASQTLSAPAHNMFAEETLGLADYHLEMHIM